jgi:hypothetical protein
MKTIFGGEGCNIQDEEKLEEYDELVENNNKNG